MMASTSRVGVDRAPTGKAQHWQPPLKLQKSRILTPFKTRGADRSRRIYSRGGASYAGEVSTMAEGNHMKYGCGRCCRLPAGAEPCPSADPSMQLQACLLTQISFVLPFPFQQTLSFLCGERGCLCKTLLIRAPSPVSPAGLAA